jgi:CTP:molybdopterin cytidylyltransferase MocA
VTGCAAEAVEAALADLVAVADPEDFVIVFNPAWEEGRVTSAAAGIGALPAGCAGFFLHHADMPFVDEAAFDALARAAGERGKAGGAPIALVASRGARPGHPVYFPASYIPAIRALGKGEKIRGVIEELGFLLVESGCDGVLDDMDSPGDFERLLMKYGLGGRPPR